MCDCESSIQLQSSKTPSKQLLKKMWLLSAWLNIHEQKRHNIGHPVILTEDIKEKLNGFLCRNDISFRALHCLSEITKFILEK